MTAISRMGPVLVLAFLAGTRLEQSPDGKKNSPDFETEILSLETERVRPLPPHTVLFTGSSSVRLWDLAQAFPTLETVNLGFGGSRMVDLNHFAKRIVFPCNPGRIVVYEGDNDIHEGYSPREVIREFKLFLSTLANQMPGTSVFFLGVKPSPSRALEMARQMDFNRMLRELCERSKGKAVFVDTFSPLLGPDGQPNPDLFLEDKLHLNEKGYARWKAVLEPLLK